jgi:hypothetical protein
MSEGNMSRDPLHDLRRWLAAEARDDPAADATFRDVFRVLPRIGPSGAFADRVVAAFRVIVPVRAWSPCERAVLRPVIGLGLVLTGLAVFAVTLTFPIPDLSVLLGAWVATVAGGAAWLSRILGVGVAVWTLCGRLGEAARVVAATPEVAFVLAGNAVVALAAFCGLRRLLSPREELISW